MRQYSHMTSEVRWRYDPKTYNTEVQKRYGIVYRERKYVWDFFRWFDTKTIEWGEWRPAPEEMPR